ncbi:MAG TPA: sensor histidine kinase [Caldimonas sp.]|jgi:signal transduction histidine kinase|nr:sensor histidine kinase [Caldimonas sp.]
MGLADFILQHLEKILVRWEQFAGGLANARAMSLAELRDDAEQILRAVCKDLSSAQTSAARDLKGKGLAPPIDACETAAQTHALLRARGGFDINEMAAEYRALRASVLALWVDEGDPRPTDLAEMIRFNEAIDQAVCESVAFFSAEQERARNLLLGILGHDMRNPLNAIQLTAHHLKKLNAGEDVSLAAGMLIRSGARMRALLDDLTDFNRKRLGLGLYIIPSDMDLRDILEDEVQQLRSAYPDREIELGLTGDLRGHWDEGRLHQVVSNLVVNALRYGKPGSTVRVTADGRDDAVLFRVENQGEPIASSALRLLFDPLRRGAGRPEEEGSLGLGLFICGEVAKAHGGEIDATSSDTGTTFTVRLPRSTSGQTTRTVLQG